jgi:diguanylate cyclase (GGDEF)-like protein/PAS domain S-box-containing protein
VRKIPVGLRHATLSLSLAAAFLLLNRPEVIVISRFGFVAWYPAAGLLLALMLTMGPWYAWLVFVSGTLSGVLIYHQALWSYSSIVAVAGGTALYAAAAYTLRGPWRIEFGLTKRRDVVRYVSVTTVAAAGSTAIGVACLAADHAILWSEYWHSAPGWFLGDEIGLLVVGPFLLIHTSSWLRRKFTVRARDGEAETKRFHRARFTAGSMLEAAGQAATLLAVVWVMFGPKWDRFGLFYLCFIPILWMAMRQGIRRVVTGLLVLNASIVVALHFYPPSAGLTQAGLLMFVVSAAGLAVGAEVSERHRLAIDLVEQTTYLDALIQSSPLGILVLDWKGNIELTNDAFQKLFLYQQSELVALNIHSLFPPDGELENASQPPELIVTGAATQKGIRRRRRDGKILDLELCTVPVMAHGRVRGTHTIYKDITEQIQAFEVERQHADSLNRLIKELESRNRQMALLNEMSNLLDCCSTTAEAGAVVVESVHKLFPEALSGALYAFKSSRNALEKAAGWGHESETESSFAPDACWALRRGKPHWSLSSSVGLTCSHFKNPSGPVCLCVPLVGQGETLGTVHLEFALDRLEHSETLRQSRETLGVALAGQIALSLANLRLRETLRDQSIRDPLTGLFNRRFMQESMERELRRARRKRHPLSVLIVDLDHFKRFNDTFGHDAGDFVLRSIAEVFRSFFRADDVLCRLGGEEFVFILPEASPEDAVIRANALRDTVKKLALTYEKQLLGAVTLSIGIASFPEHSLDADELLKIADQCLYQSKAKGRDMVSLAGTRALGAGSRP